MVNKVFFSVADVFFFCQAKDFFQKAQTDRRDHQQKLTNLHSQLKELHASLDKVQRGDERYLALMTEEYNILREEKQVAAALSQAEKTEHESFSSLSLAVRESHERERDRAERTKYWAII